MTPPSDRDQVAFLTNVQRLLTEGGFVASYKYALIITLVEFAIEHGDDSGRPLRVPLPAIAERFIRLYWRQAAPHPAGRVLQQNTDKQAAIVNLVREARDRQPSLPRLMRERGAWTTLVRKVASAVKIMPLFKLQTLGADKCDFLYPNILVDGGIELRPGVAFCLRRFNALIEDLVRGAWVRFVRRLPANSDLLGESTDLTQFMFGSERGDLRAVLPILLDVQEGCCFYCGGAIRSKQPAVDHFIPWSRYPADLGHNFVVADAACNNAKSDMLAAVPHLDRWCRRNRNLTSRIAKLFDEPGVLHDLAASYRITSWAYASAVKAQAQVWMAKQELLPLGPEWRILLDGTGSDDG